LRPPLGHFVVGCTAVPNVPPPPLSPPSDNQCTPPPPAPCTHRREHWRSWDPHFLLYSRPELHTAQTRAADLADYQPAWQLTPPSQPLPAFFASLANLPAHPWLLRLLQYILASTADAEPWGLAANMARQSESVTQGLLKHSGGTSGGSAGRSDVEMADTAAATAAAAAAAEPLAAAMAAATGEDRGQILRMLLQRISSGRRRRRSSVATQVGSRVLSGTVTSRHSHGRMAPSRLRV
jgi:hypothetical protein